MKPYKFTCPWYLAEVRKDKAAMNRWYGLTLAETIGEPGWAAKPYRMLERVRKVHEAKILYAAALAKKRGLIPVNATGWTAAVTEAGVLFEKAGETVFVLLNLTPAPAAVEYLEAA